MPDDAKNGMTPEPEPPKPEPASLAQEVTAEVPSAESAPAPVPVAAQPAAAKAPTPEPASAPEPAAAKEAALQPAPPATKSDLVRAAYEHPLPIRITHWVNAISLFVMSASGLRIFRAFPSFGPKVPEQVLIDIPKSLTIGGWLGGALQWHFTFMWFFAAGGILYVAYQIFSGHYRTVLFTPKDIRGVWPMARHYFLFGPKPPATGQYNPLQKLAYTSTVFFGAVSLLTGIIMYKPTQFSWLAWIFGGYHYARGWHFAALCGFLAFIPGHLIMVLIHGWANFYSMLSGWKREPEYQD